jgi:hypothetical protein
VVLAIALGIFLYFRRHKKQVLQSHQDHQDVSSPLDGSNAPEVRTHWDQHEHLYEKDAGQQVFHPAGVPMAACHDLPVEADAATAVLELGSDSRALHPPSELAVNPLSSSRNANQVRRKSLVSSDRQTFAGSEAGFQDKNSPSLGAISQNESSLPEPLTGLQLPDLSAASGASNDETKLSILQSRIDKVRAEKERLTRLQALEQIEMDLQEEILAEQRRTMGLQTP